MRGLYLPYKGLWRETSSVELFRLIYFPQNSSSLLVFLQHTVKPSQRCCFIFSSGNTILQANKYNWQFLNILSKSSFSFQVIFPNPISHITFSAPRWYSSSLIKCFLCCPVASLYVFNLNPSLINPGSKYLSCARCSSLHPSSCQYLPANETSASPATGDPCLSHWNWIGLYCCQISIPN